mgnify:CR=1 FL=1
MIGVGGWLGVGAVLSFVRWFVGLVVGSLLVALCVVVSITSSHLSFGEYH